MRTTSITVLLATTIMLGVLPAACSQSKVKDTTNTSSPPVEGTAVNKEGTFAVFETSMGMIEAELYADDAPKTVANFIGLAEEKYYDGVLFHRVSRGFVIQGGDPTGKGSGGKTLSGKPLEDELNPATPSFRAGYVTGVLALANTSRATTGTSQFFIMLNDVPRMPKSYTIFGKVVKGMDIVDAIGQVDITPEMGPNDGRPKTAVVIKKVTIRRESVEEKK